MSAQSSLKALSGAVLSRTMQRTLSAQYKKESTQYPHIAQKTGNSIAVNSNAELLQIEMIRGWLFKIGEPPEDHDLVLSKCRNDPEVLEYFMRHAGELE